MTMPSRLAVTEAVAEWVQVCSREETVTDFRRARIFDGFAPKLMVEALRALSADKAQRLVRLLALSVPQWRPGDIPVVLLSADEQQEVTEFKRAVMKSLRKDRSILDNAIGQRRKPETLVKARRIRKLGVAALHEFSARHQFELQRFDARCWRLASLKKWGSVSVQFDFQIPLELKYGVFAYDPAGMPFRFADHYLGILGIAPSVWSIADADTCQEKILQACEFVKWHIDEYDRIITSL